MSIFLSCRSSHGVPDDVHLMSLETGVWPMSSSVLLNIVICYRCYFLPICIRTYYLFPRFIAFLLVLHFALFDDICCAFPNIQSIFYCMNIQRMNIVQTNKLKSRHFRLTNSYLMDGEDLLRWVACDCDLAPNHILIECGDFAEVRQRFYDAENIRNQCYRCI